MTCDFPDLGDWGGLVPAEVDPVAVERAESLAWSSMLALTAGRVTLCPVTVRPVCWRCQRQTWVTAPTWMSTPVNGWGNVYATGVIDGAIPYWGFEHGGGCDGSGFDLPLERPIGAIVSVSIDGTVLPSSAYRVDGGFLRRIDGQAWPTTQDLNAVSGTGVFEITYYQGTRPSKSFIWATGRLASEFYLAMTPDSKRKCRLPDNVTAVTRQGVTYQVNAGLFADGITGIREIDAVLRAVNPNALKQATVVMSADTIAHRPRRVY